MRSSPSILTRTGVQSGSGNSDESNAGSQKRLNSSPIGVPRPVWLNSSLSSLVSTVPLLAFTLCLSVHLLGKAEISLPHHFYTGHLLMGKAVAPGNACGFFQMFYT